MKNKIKRIIYITIAWTIISLANYLIGIAAIIDANYIWDAEYDLSKIPFWYGFYVSILTSILAGILGGGVLVFLWEQWLRTKPYGWTLRNMFMTYVILFNVISIPVILLNNSLPNNYELLSREAWNEVVVAYQSPSLLVPFFFWMTIVCLTLLAFQVNDKYGPGVFRKFLLGKYFIPTREERIFMFLDLRSSTTIAEKLGEEKYFHFIRKVFETVTPAVLKNGGEIYQYVGDEMVVSWEKQKGIEDNQCIRCFFDAEQLLLDDKTQFLSDFGIFPEFKAGLHYGFVMAGEIGVVKREIAYSGDVLNTAARIQAKCNEFGVNILVSDVLLDQVNSKGLSKKNFGFINLRGKSKELQLYTIAYEYANSRSARASLFLVLPGDLGALSRSRLWLDPADLAQISWLLHTLSLPNARVREWW